jgi:hypothetical protein
MMRRILGRTSIWLFVVGLTASHAAGPVAPSIRIVSPTPGFVTSGSLSVVVEFHASANSTNKAKAPTGNVQTIALEVNGAAVAEFDNPSNVKTGRHTFEIDLSGFPEGAITIEAVAYQGAARAGHAGRSGRARVLIDRDLGDGTLVGPAGGLLGTADGGLHLEIPAGALQTATSIKATRIDPAGLPTPDRAVPGTIAYELEPDGLRFAKPVKATLRLDEHAMLQGGNLEHGLSVIASVSGSTVEVLRSQDLTTSANTGETTISGPITHFSRLGDFTIAPGVSLRITNLPSAGLPVGGTFVPTVLVFDTAESVVRADRVDFVLNPVFPIQAASGTRFLGSLDPNSEDRLKLDLPVHRCGSR